MRHKLLLAVAALGLLVAMPAAAHHSFAAEYDSNNLITLNGVITKVEWTNPHMYIHIDVKGADGKVVNWHFELGPPNALIRLGWKKDAIPVGIELNIEGFRAKSGEAVANGRSIKMPDGRELFSGGSGPGETAK